MYRGGHAVTTTLTPPTEEAPKRPKSKKGRQFLGLDAGLWVLIIPALIPIILFSVVPLMQGVYLGFTNAEAGRNTVTAFNGLDNYREMLDNRIFFESFKIGLIWAVTVTFLQFVLSMGLALLLNADLKGQSLYRVLVLVPWAMPPVVVGLMWRLVYHPTAGVLNEALEQLHITDANINWLQDFALVLPAVIVVGVWRGMPQTTITLLAGLQGVPDDQKEAAAVDGAGAWQSFRNVTLPSMMPVVVAITTLNLIWNFNSFGLVFVLTGGGPGGRTRLPLLFAYEEGFKFGNFGFAAALGNVMVLVMVFVLFFYLRRQLKPKDES